MLRWLRLESPGDGGCSQSAAVEAGLKQGSAGWSGHGCGRTGTQGTAAAGLELRARLRVGNVRWLFC